MRISPRATSGRLRASNAKRRAVGRFHRCALEDSGNRLYVHFPKGAWGFSPRSLVPLKLEDESINELKSTFKRFDKSGDGKLSPEA